MEDTDHTVLQPNGDDDFDDNASSIFADDEEPTDEECKTLRRVADQLPWSVWYVLPRDSKLNANLYIYLP